VIVHSPEREAKSGDTETRPEPGREGCAPGAGSYGQILRSSVLVGGAQVFNVAVGIVRSKCVALLLGPAGFGLMGLYTSIANLAQSVAGMGINSSGVRQIAAAVGTGEMGRVARTAAILRLTSAALGAGGALLLIALSVPVARVSFGGDDRVMAIAILSLAVLFKVVSDGQAALIQGLRRIGDLVRVSVVGGLAGSAVAVALVWALREGGVVPALVAMAAGTLGASWWFSRRAGIELPRVTLREARREAGDLLSLGFAFMASALMVMGAAYLVRLFIVRRLGLEAAGLFHSAWTAGVLYVSFVLQALGADFYPRLTAIVKNRAECNRLVNEQAQVSLLLAGPGIIATVTFAPLVISALYSSAFLGAVDVLRWTTLGAALQVITWPVGFVIVAEGRRGLFLAAELAYTAMYLTLAWVLVQVFGVTGAGVAYFLSYVVHLFIVYPLAHHISGFRWTPANARLGLAFLGVAGGVVGAFSLLPAWAALACGALALLASTVYSVRVLAGLLSPERVPPAVRRVLTWVGAGARRGPLRRSP
jgi:enterobacterial common antigen flippase